MRAAYAIDVTTAATPRHKGVSCHEPIDLEAYRQRLMNIARRLLGSAADAEDAVQEAYLRWHATDVTGIRSAEAWLTTVVTRICIDRIRLKLREHNVAEVHAHSATLDAPDESAPERHIEVSDQLSAAVVALLEQLTEYERAAYVLRDLLGYSYDEIAATLGKTQDASRQLFHRATKALRQGSAKRNVSDAERRRTIQAFLAAMERGDEGTILQLLAPSVLQPKARGSLAGRMKREKHAPLTRDPAAVLREVVNGLVEAWSSPESRSLMTLLTQEMLNDVGGSNGLFHATNSILQDLRLFFGRWQTESRIPKGEDPQILAWQLFTPLIYLRLAYFQASAPDEHVRIGRSLAQRHVEYFIRRHFK